MTMTDPIADLLIRLRNAIGAKHETVVIPSSKIKLEIVRILKEEEAGSAEMSGPPWYEFRGQAPFPGTAWPDRLERMRRCEGFAMESASGRCFERRPAMSRPPRIRHRSQERQYFLRRSLWESLNRRCCQRWSRCFWAPSH